jgi:leucyl/phenylalanyl-tRNA--protein transferase
MFSVCSNASKTAFLIMAKWLHQRSFPLIDCQVKNPHLVSLGAQEIARAEFEKTLKQHITPTLVHASILDWQNASGKQLSNEGELLL